MARIGEPPPIACANGQYYFKDNDGATIVNEELFKAVSRYGERHADFAGVAQTPIASLRTIYATAPTGLQYDISRPLACLVLGGEKHVTIGRDAFTFGAGESLLVTADVPTVSQLTRASRSKPYCSLILDLDPMLIMELSGEMKAVPIGDARPVRIEPTDREVADAALRLMRLLERPSAVAILEAQSLREMHYWLLAGRHGAAIRRLGLRDDHAQSIGRAVAVLRAEFARPLRVEGLAETAGMSASSFHQHFRNLTSLSPLQFQKHLRLVEARRLMLTERASVRIAAFAVGYESVSQFTREYGRMFGQTPARDKVAAAGSNDTVDETSVEMDDPTRFEMPRRRGQHSRSR